MNQLTKLIKELEDKDRQPRKYHLSPAILLGLSDEEIISIWNSREEDRWFDFTIPVGAQMYERIQERLKKLNLI